MVINPRYEPSSLDRPRVGTTNSGYMAMDTFQKPTDGNKSSLDRDRHPSSHSGYMTMETVQKHVGKGEGPVRQDSIGEEGYITMARQDHGDVQESTSFRNPMVLSKDHDYEISDVDMTPLRAVGLNKTDLSQEKAGYEGVTHDGRGSVATDYQSLGQVQQAGAYESLSRKVNPSDAYEALQLS